MGDMQYICLNNMDLLSVIEKTPNNSLICVPFLLLPQLLLLTTVYKSVLRAQNRQFSLPWQACFYAMWQLFNFLFASNTANIYLSFWDCIFVYPLMSRSKDSTSSAPAARIPALWLRLMEQHLPRRAVPGQKSN